MALGSFVLLCGVGIQLLCMRDILPQLIYLSALTLLTFGARWMGWLAWFRRLWTDENTTIRIAFYVFLGIFPLLMTFLQETLRLPAAGWIHHGTEALRYVILAEGLNLIVGFTGLLVLGYIAFYALGAYTFAILITAPGAGWWMLWLAFPIAALVGATAGFGLGGPTLRLRGDYLAIVTLGFGEIVWIVVTNWDGLTNGPKGIPTPVPMLWDLSLSKSYTLFGLRLQQTVPMYYLTLSVCCVVIFSIRRLYLSRVGRAWVAIREDELAAQAMGINTVWYKLLAFALSAAIAAVAGVLFTAKARFVDPNSFIFLESALVLCMVVLGGMGSLPGAAVGAVLVVFLKQKLQAGAEWRMAIFGLLLVAMMVLKPEGLWPSRQMGRELHHKT